MLRGIRRNFFRLSPCCGQVPYVLLTRAPVAGGSIAAPPLPLDLHVLSLSLAFILSQDQTLRCFLLSYFSSSFQLNDATEIVCCLLLSRRDEPLTAPIRRMGRVAQRTCLPLTPVYFVSSCMGWKLTGESYRRRSAATVSCTTSIVAILSMFSCLTRGVPRKSDAKVLPFLIPSKFLSPF